eukprot:1154767-Pelagomonas_calceolata.AAC.3
MSGAGELTAFCPLLYLIDGNCSRIFYRESGQWVSRAEVSVGKEVLAEEHSGLSKMAAKQVCVCA